jgi:hypothetical protein
VSVPGDAYLVFFVRDPVGDALARAVLDSVRDVQGAGGFDDPAAPSASERTTGGFVRVADPGQPAGAALLALASRLSAEHAVGVEVQWREEVLGRFDAGTWTAGGGPAPGPAV